MSKSNYDIQVGDLLYDEALDRIGWVHSVNERMCHNHWSDGNYGWNSFMVTQSYKDEAFMLDRKILRETKK
jgi:hypothetical protein